MGFSHKGKDVSRGYVQDTVEPFHSGHEWILDCYTKVAVLEEF